MNSFNVEELSSGIYFTADVMLDKTFILLTNSIPLTDSMKSALKDWDFKQIFSDGTLSTISASNNFSPNTSEVSIEDFTGPAESTNPTSQISSEKLNEVKKALANAETIDLDDIGKEIIEKDTETKRLAAVTTVYNEYLNYITKVYTNYATRKELDLEDLSSTVKELCVYIKDNKRYILRIESNQEKLSKEYLISHALRSTIYSIIIGIQLRLPLSNLIELGVASILHEIGMIRLPPQLYMTDKVLTSSEKKLLFSHPILSYNILQENNFPIKICLGVLEHHERENGTGYPSRLLGEKISTYAKIISVACSYEAITAPRHYKDAQSSYEAMVDLLKNNRQIYDENVIKALLYSLSLFPIGGYVYLSDGKIAQVVDVNAENPKNPIVEIISTTKKVEPERIKTSDTGIKIVRALTKQETEDVKKTQAELA